ncbi:plasmid partitioning protein RepB C-terminal domain-containing protein [uncultured Microbulbifer sp.]|uniref:plasmid partitioning protein RepB C-terminal domain-containing protein n=1 Tax=uncultured Microbulbifer sp. TaxID=348147 RepID=UPI00261D399B|nr:plasmid partitioning protein RepB C-terminal domain-containing protein [uncultured Microbulbifer sp.]
MTENSIISIDDGGVKMAFINSTVDLRIEQLIPTKPIPKTLLTSKKYLQILTSIKAVGIIEPPAVIAESNASDLYIILDGHLRIEALKEINESKVTCLISIDDESFTYNKHINRLTAIQEHQMILKAIKRGVPEDKIARALGVDVKSIIQKRDLLTGICPEAVNLLKDKHAPAGTFHILKKMKSIRQIQAATLMNDAGTYSVSYARVLWTATPKSQLVNPDRPKKIKGLTEAQIDRMESEMANLEKEYQLVEESYGTDVLNLTLAKGYLTKLLDNAQIVNYLAHRQTDIFNQLQRISEINFLDESLLGNRQ